MSIAFSHGITGILVLWSIRSYGHISRENLLTSIAARYADPEDFPMNYANPQNLVFSNWGRRHLLSMLKQLVKTWECRVPGVSFDFVTTRRILFKQSGSLIYLSNESRAANPCRVASTCPMHKISPSPLQKYPTPQLR
ncbi:hypothetical protein DFS33DRAFT_112084 [Desarmillaria ectypa]|nr:hypothetical protein DFS33DRAFT_112084 [Desarmillaria ectypa]